MRPNKKEPESALFWFQSLSQYLAHTHASNERNVARMAASYTIFNSTPGSEDAYPAPIRRDGV
jgi:hypothetical protein